MRSLVRAMPQRAIAAERSCSLVSSCRSAQTGALSRAHSAKCGKDSYKLQEHGGDCSWTFSRPYPFRLIHGWRLPTSCDHTPRGSLRAWDRGRGLRSARNFNCPGQRFAFVFGARTEGLVIFCKCVDAKRLSIDLFCVIEHGSDTVQAPKCTPVLLIPKSACHKFKCSLGHLLVKLVRSGTKRC